MKKIIAIDPGLRKVGWAVINSKSGHLQYVAHGLIRTENASDLPNRILNISQELKIILQHHMPDEFAIEETFVNKNAVSSLKLGHARGAIILTAALEKLPVFEYSANFIKKTVASSGHASKDQIKRMVAILLNLPDKDLNNLKEDEADAMAIAICHASQLRF